MKTDTLGIGIVGAGLIGTMHSIGLRGLIERNVLPIRLAHAVDIDPGKAETFKNVFGYEKASADPESLIKDKAVDAVYVCTPTSEHFDLVMAAAAEKKHIFCEKPLAFTAAEAGQMRDKVVEAGVIHQVGLVLRGGPVWNVLRYEVREKNTGFPITFTFRDDQCFPVKGLHASAWRKDPAKAGHGTIIEHSIHDLDLIEWIFGPVTSIRAHMDSRFGHTDIEDLARVDMELESGMTGTLISVWHNVLNRHSNRRVEVFHERVFHTIESEYIGPIHRTEGEGNAEVIPAEEVNKKFWEIRGIEDPVEREISLMFGGYEDYLFCRSIIENKSADPDFNIAVKAHKLVDACYESSQKNERIKP